MPCLDDTAVRPASGRHDILGPSCCNAQPFLLPSLPTSLVPQLSDIPPTITKVPTTVKPLADGATLLGHDLFTNDVLYLEVRGYDTIPAACGVRHVQGRPGLCSTLLWNGHQAGARTSMGRVWQGASLAIAALTY